MASRSLRSFAALLLGVSVATCGGGGDSSGPDNPNTGGGGVTVSLSPASLSIVRTRSASTTVTVARPGSTPPSVTLSTNVGAGITATFDPPSLSGGRLSSTLTIALSPSSGVGSFTLYIAATPTSGDTTSAVAQLSITVTAEPTVTVAKAGSGTGTVTSNPAGINCGGVCSAPFFSDVTLTAAPASGSAFASWSGQCTGTDLTCTFTPRAGSIVTATFNSTAPSFTLAASPSTLSVQQGSTGSATITTSRINGFTSPVTVTASGVPTGVTATFNPTSITGTQSTLTVGVAPSVPAGNYPITVTGTGSGVAPKTATFSLVVTPASGSSGTIALNFADCDPTQRPIWLATQSGGGAWTRVNGTNNTFAFNVAGATGIAYVTQNGSEYATFVQYFSAAELTAVATGPGICGSTEQTGTKRVMGTFANYGGTATSYWTMALGGVFASGDTASVLGPGYTLTNVAAGPRDLIAARIGVSKPFTQAQTMIVRRATNYANNGFIPLLDIGINGPETFTPVQIFTTVTNRGGDSTIASVALVTKQGRSTDYYTTPPSPNDVNRYPALPSDRIQDGEYHLVSVFATANPANPTSFRFTELLQHAPANRTITLGPPINPATVTTLGASAPLRLRAQVASQTDYNGAAEADYTQSDRSVSITSTAAYVGGLPTTWSLDVPDLSSAGYDPTWGLRAGQNVDWGVVALSADNLASFAGGALVDNAQILGAASLGSTAASQARATMRVGPARSIADLMRRVP
jgi:hypothetical protein